MQATQLLQYLLAGIATGSVYAVVAIGFTVVYNATGIINFAQGEFLMLGGMIAISLAPLMPLPAAIAVAVLATGAAGVLLQIVFLSWLKNPAVLRMIIMPLALVLVMLFWPRGILGLREFRGFIPRRDRRAHGAARLKGTDAHDAADSH